MLCDQMIKLYAIEQFKSLNYNKFFSASSGWCTNFKNKFFLSTVRCSIYKKASTPYTEKELYSVRTLFESIY